MATTHQKAFTSMLVVAGSLAASTAIAQQPLRPPQSPPGTVTLTLAEYDRLTDRAERPARRPDLPPIPAVVARAEAVVRITGGCARGTFTLEGEVFHTGITRVPLLSGATIVDARVGATSLPLLREGEVSVALVEGPRPFTIAVDWGADVTSASGRAWLAMPVPTAGSVRASIELTGTVADVRLEPGAITRTSVSAGVTRVEATLVPGSQARLSWASRQAEAPTSRDVRTLADVKTIVSLRDAELRLTSLVEVTVLVGQPDRVELVVPAGFVVTGASGATLDGTDERPGVLMLRLNRPAERRHQFLVNLERQTVATGPLELPLPTVSGAERETGEVAVEAEGTVELTVKETDVLRRMDVREASPPLMSLAGHAILAALRYHRRAPASAIVSLDVTRFADAAVIAAVADRAVATTLVTVDGRTLTEIALTMRNRAQPFLRVELPAGASMVSAEVAGETAKLAQGSDGTRVPLLRPGFRPNGPYTVSFVYVQSGQPFAKKGRAELVLPRMDIPVALVEWEMFVPDRYRVRRFEGNAMLEPAPVLLVSGEIADGRGSGVGAGRGGEGGGTGGGEYRASPGQIVGRVVDAAGAVLSGAEVTAAYKGQLLDQAIANAAGWFILPNVRPGRLTLTARLEGFKTAQAAVSVDSTRPRRVDLQMEVGVVQETVTVAADGAESEEFAAKSLRDASAQSAPSRNVFNLQRRVVGVLPVRIDVPRAGAAYRFVRPLVLDETTNVSFDYRTR